MQKEYGILKINKNDSKKTKFIKRYNNKLIESLGENNAFAVAGGIMAGIGVSLTYTTLNAIRSEEPSNVIIGTAIGAILFAGVSVGIFSHVKNQEKINNEKIEDLSNTLIDEVQEKTLHFEVKYPLNK